MKKLLIALALLLTTAGATLYLSPSALLASVQFTERQLAGLSLKYAQVGDLNLTYYEGGPADAPSIVMIHGFGADKDNWLRFAKPLTATYHVIALDLPGFGDSSKPDISYDVGSQTERLAAFTKHLGLHKLHLIGNSMGGHIAALYAARYPEQVLSVALLDNAGISSPNKSEMFQRIERGEPNPLLVNNSADFSKMLSFVFVEQPVIPDALKQHFAEQSIANRPLNEKIFSHLRDRYIPLEPELAKIQAPTLVLWGDKDRVLDMSSIAVMQPLLKQPTVVVMKDCGHVPMIERPSETAAHYQAFLDSSKS